MADNNRIYFAVEQFGIKGDGVADYSAIHGFQSAGLTTSFNLENYQSWGQLEPYELIEDIPVVEVTANKTLDGYPLIFHEATVDAVNPTIAGRSTSKCLISIAYFDETLDRAQGAPSSQVEISGAFFTSVRYSFPISAPFNEEVGFQANDKIWHNDPNMVAAPTWDLVVFSGAFANTDSPQGSGGVNRRQHLLFGYSASGLDVNGMVADPDTTILPPDIWGITSSGTNEFADGKYGAHVQDITVSADFAREDLLEQGRKGPYARSITYPFEVTCEVATISVSGDMVSATEGGILNSGGGQCAEANNLRNRTIRIATCEGTRIYLGPKCKLTSSNTTGGDATGGNVTNSYTFTAYNTITVLHPEDPNSAGSTWWTNREDWLVDLT